jgi:membrane protein YqaA with SNARE-associated domain
MTNHTAKHFVLQLGSLIALYLSLVFFLVLTFGFINLRFPDGLDSVWQVESAASSIRIGFAMVVVFFPTYLVLTRMVNKNRRSSKDNSYLALTKWMIYLSLLVAGLTLLGDLVAVIMGFLEGELTSRFLLKALAVFVVIGAAFYYYIRDAQGYWLKNEKTSLAYGAGATVIIAAVLIASLGYIQTPAEVREVKADQEIVSDLQDIQWRVESHYERFENLPVDMDSMYLEISAEDNPPDAPEGRANYTYSITDAEENKYKLCGDFKYDSNKLDNQYRPAYPAENAVYWKNNNWEYKAGEWCFDRVINIEFKQ